jgi:hypothetical protein
LAHKTKSSSAPAAQRNIESVSNFKSPILNVQLSSMLTAIQTVPFITLAEKLIYLCAMPKDSRPAAKASSKLCFFLRKSNDNFLFKN